MNIQTWYRKDWLMISALIVIALLIYYPVFSTNYLYTDEAVQLWNYRTGSSFHMFIEQGRYITDRLMSMLFSNADTIADLRFLRLFSLAGWVLVIPVWYFILKKVFVREGITLSLVPVLVLWLICSPTVTISIAWASCLELFIAYTAGLISGYIAYSHLRYDHELQSRRSWVMPLSALFGLISLFTYQNGFGAFLIPFFIHAVANPGRYQKIAKGVVAFAIIAVLYFAIFKYQMKSLGIVPNERTGFGLDIIQKFKFFIFRPLTSAFHLGYLFNEQEHTGIIVFALVLVLLVLASIRLVPRLILLRGNAGTASGNGLPDAGNVLLPTLRHLGLLFILCLMIYFPSLIVKESFSSNRTLLALSFAICCFVLITMSFLLTSRFFFRATFLLLSLCFIGNAWFNYNFQFRKPIQQEYLDNRRAFDAVYRPGLTAFTVSRPREDQFTAAYGITRSWDEFGVPSLFFPWVPEPYFRQLMLEKTGNRQAASVLKVTSHPAVPPAQTK